MQSSGFRTESRGFCEGCKKEKTTLDDVYEYRCGPEGHCKLCEECRNQEKCPVHEMARHPG